MMTALDRSVAIVLVRVVGVHMVGLCWLVHLLNTCW